MNKTNQELQKVLQKTYNKSLLVPFIKAICDYDLVSDNDKIAVCISGGKDSLLLALLFMELKRHNKFNFDLEFLCMDPGYTSENRQIIEENCRELGIPLKIFNSDIFSVTQKNFSKYPCYMCARMRRGFLYNKAKELGCNKIALAHHFDDCIETTLLNIFYGNQFMTMVPKIKAKNYKDMFLIRPMIYIREKDIIKFKNYAGINSINCGCTVACNKTSSKRAEVKRLVKSLETIDPKIPLSIFNSGQNVNLECILGYRTSEKKVDFNEIFNELKGENDDY